MVPWRRWLLGCAPHHDARGVNNVQSIHPCTATPCRTRTCTSSLHPSLLLHLTPSRQDGQCMVFWFGIVHCACSSMPCFVRSAVMQYRPSLRSCDRLTCVLHCAVSMLEWGLNAPCSHELVFPCSVPVPFLPPPSTSLRHPKHTLTHSSPYRPHEPLSFTPTHPPRS